MNEKKEKYTAVVLAAGKGTRMGGSVAKQFLEIGGKPVVVYALEVFEHSPEIDQIILVTGADKIEYCQKEIIEKYGIKKTVSVCAGGRERYESVWKALQTLKSLESEQEQKTDYVLIHDGARPFLNQEMLERLCACVKEEKACVLGMPVKGHRRYHFLFRQTGPYDFLDRLHLYSCGTVCHRMDTSLLHTA